ncbi:hypothetical protein HPB50_019412 [Hyalomma asiaticum]|uniref:Uncharacterized protein n=1 Tax=Hyalomma asiaticum TaxID=266040 RepID=A0ACB7RQQ1_HYAAI|nr:hypothetical protein HPB50_019412 [Hyalomma asiaticum]
MRIAGPSSISNVDTESAQGVAGAGPLQSGAPGAARGSGTNETLRTDRAAEKQSDASPLSTGTRGAVPNDDHGPAGENEVSASVRVRLKDVGEREPTNAASAAAVADGTVAKVEDPKPSSVTDSAVEKNGGAQQPRLEAEEKASPILSASEPAEREMTSRSSVRHPVKYPLWSTSELRVRGYHRAIAVTRKQFFRTQVASSKKLQPSGIVILLLYVGIVITLVVLTIALFTKNFAQRAQTCATSECHEYAALLASSVDASVRPCNSFARFVCGRWDRGNVPDSGQNDVQRAAAAFRTCDDVLGGRADHLAAVKRALGDAGITWPRAPDRVDVPRTLLFSTLNLAWDAIVRLVPRCSGNATTLTMDPGRHFYRVAEKVTNPLSESEFKVYFNTLRKAFGAGGNEDDEASLAETAALDRIISLALASKYHHRTASPVPLDVPRGHSHRIAGNAARLRLGNNGTHLLTSWSTVQVAAQYANKELILNYYGGNGEVASVRYTAFCFSTAYLLSRGAPFRNYESETVSNDARRNADRVMLFVSNAYIRRLSKWAHFEEDITVVADWSATPSGAFNETRVTATDDGCQGNGGEFPDMTDSLMYNWRSSSRLIANIPDDFYEVVRAVNSLELSVPSPVSKTLRLLPMSFWFPLFDVRFASAVNYAGIGGQVGSALSWLLITAYASDSRSADVISNLSVCVDKYSSPAIQVDSALTQALTAGVLVDAYEYGTADRDSRVGAYSGTQLLFMAMCFFACAGRDAANEAAVCDLTMRQSSEFARVFKCAPGTPMNPKKRCDLP